MEVGINVGASAPEVQIRYGTNAHVKACIFTLMHLMRPVLLKFALRYIDPHPKKNGAEYILLER